MNQDDIVRYIGLDSSKELLSSVDLSFTPDSRAVYPVYYRICVEGILRRRDADLMEFFSRIKRNILHLESLEIRYSVHEMTQFTIEFVFDECDQCIALEMTK